jgi:hypothetical protein
MGLGLKPVAGAASLSLPQSPKEVLDKARWRHHRGGVVLDGFAAQLGCLKSGQRAAVSAEYLKQMRALLGLSPVSNLARKTLPEGHRLNACGDEVIFKTTASEKSAGHDNMKLFAELGSHAHGHFYSDRMHSARLARIASRTTDETERRKCIATLRRRAEQEYILQNMDKGSLQDAADLADLHEKGIATRPTGLAAHMSSESEGTTKPVEIKNKTAKAEDIWLSDELTWDDIGKVVHYDPSVGWTSTKAAEGWPASTLTDEEIETRWQARLASIQARANRFPGKTMPPVEKLREAFISRIKEYAAEDSAYRAGQFSDIVTFAGPKLRLKVRPDVDIFGDRDLAVFTDPEGGIVEEDLALQISLQRAKAFQAQHGGIYYWKPLEEGKPAEEAKFNEGIKKKIMGSHGPEGDSPLILVLPGGEVTAAFFVPHERGDPSGDRLDSVWKHKDSLKWLETTSSGRYLAALRPDIRNLA